MRENCSVGCELEGSSRQGESEQKMIGDQSPKASSLHKKEFFSSELERRVYIALQSIPRDTTTGTIKETEKTKVAILKIILFLTGGQ